MYATTCKYSNVDLTHFNFYISREKFSLKLKGEVGKAVQEKSCRDNRNIHVHVYVVIVHCTSLRLLIRVPLIPYPISFIYMYCLYMYMYSKGSTEEHY